MLNLFKRKQKDPVLTKVVELKKLCQTGKMPDYEEVLKDNYSRIILEGDTVIDIGAHIGRHLQNFLSLAGTSGTVHGVEPLPEQFNILKRLCKSGTNVYLHNIALSNFEGTSDFCFADGQPEESGLKQRIYNNPSAVTPKTIRVEVKTIDKYFRNIPRLDYVKIDAEGAEISILNGGKKTFQRYRPIISVEYGYPSYSVYGLKNTSLYDWCSENGYYVSDLYGNIIYDRNIFKKVCDSIYWDYFLVPNEKESSFRKHF